jgi:ectoine hydroxylase-related dioxygenase (phytanoyl-CoA dioxygenase family)
MGTLARLDGLEMIITSLVDGSPLLDDPQRLREIAERDGFLYLRGLLAENLVLGLRATILEFAERIGWLDGEAPVSEARALPGKRVGCYQDPDWVNLQVHVQNRPEMWALGDHRAIHRALSAVEGRSSYLYLSTANTCRVFSPHADMATQPHQDGHYFKLTADFWTVWIPLGDCPLELGPLALLAGSHKLGLQNHTGLGVADGGVAVPEDTCWSAGHLRCGDAILFHPFTLHRSLPNESGRRLRLSADFRYGFWDGSSSVDWRRHAIAAEPSPPD